VRLTKEAGGSEELGRWVRTEGIEGVNGVSAELKAVLGFPRGTGAAVRGGSMMASTAA
jgi:hypothetical protein